jgi:hypothetical protein
LHRFLKHILTNAIAYTRRRITLNISNSRNSVKNGIVLPRRMPVRVCESFLVEDLMLVVVRILIMFCSLLTALRMHSRVQMLDPIIILRLFHCVHRAARSFID